MSPKPRTIERILGWICIGLLVGFIYLSMGPDHELGLIGAGTMLALVAILLNYRDLLVKLITVFVAIWSGRPIPESIQFEDSDRELEDIPMSDEDAHVDDHRRPEGGERP